MEQKNKPRIIGGMCEYCGTPAYLCQHYLGIINQDGSLIENDNQTILVDLPESKKVVPPPINFTNTNKIYKDFNNQKVADIIIPHHTNHSDLAILLQNIDVSIFNIIICAGNSFGVNCNKGAELAETNKLIFINDDVEIFNHQLIKLVNNIGKYDFIGSTQLAGIGKIKKYWGIALFENSDGTLYHQITFEKNNSLFPSGFLFGIKRNIWEKMDGFNPKFKTGNEDVDFGLRALKENLKMRIFDLEIRHKECQSIGRFDHIEENEKLIYSIWNQKKLRTIFNKYYANSTGLPDHDISVGKSVI